jgi:hypothetical protein
MAGLRLDTQGVDSLLAGRKALAGKKELAPPVWPSWMQLIQRSPRIQ